MMKNVVILLFWYTMFRIFGLNDVPAAVLGFITLVVLVLAKERKMFE